mmetsp:Transcript_48034/g.154976  ORF Transcript_48034/g.154976 Transcript_48034/m.154976 type:complete len:156 (-) Transcript_48034:887-1354(-)
MHDAWTATAGEPEKVMEREIVGMTGFLETMTGGDIESLGDELDQEAEPDGFGGSCLQRSRAEVAVRHLASPGERRAQSSDEECDDCDDADIVRRSGADRRRRSSAEQLSSDALTLRWPRRRSTEQLGSDAPAPLWLLCESAEAHAQSCSGERVLR